MSRVRVPCLRLEYLIKTFGKYPDLCHDIYVVVLRRHYDPFLSNTSHCITAPRLKVRPYIVHAGESRRRQKKKDIFSLRPNSATDGDRVPVGARFCAPVLTGPLAHPASCIVAGQYVSFSGLKRPECGVDHSPPSMYNVICIFRLFITCLTFEIVLPFCLYVATYSFICGHGP
jgi:hypothetical protein